MTSAQLTANRANALLSTGPVTAEGKAASSRNSYRHGLTAKNAMLPGDDPEEYKQHCQVFFNRFAHRDELERQLVQDLADIRWKLCRIPAIESAILDSGDLRGLATISMYAQRLRRDFDTTLASLRKLQAVPAKEEIKNGFVYSATPPKPKLICGACRTWNEKGPICEHCGSRHLMTEEQFDWLYPTVTESQQAVASDSQSQAEPVSAPAGISPDGTDVAPAEHPVPSTY